MQKMGVVENQHTGTFRCGSIHTIQLNFPESPSTEVKNPKTNLLWIQVF